MKRKEDQPLNISSGSRVASKRTREINHNGNNNENTVSDGSSTHVESERVESSFNINEYNNVIAIKQESSTGDENQEIPQSEVNNADEDKNVDTSSFSLDPSENNVNNEFSATSLEDTMQSALDNKSDIKLNADELHLLNITQSSQEKAEGSKTKQQQQEKEKFVVKIESNGNENKEKETIAQLEEKINEYKNKVSCLHQEKVEIQTTLQNKIHQLTLVIGQHETQVEHLTSTLSQKLDEINQLNSQVTQQQSEIALLNKESRLNSVTRDLLTSENVDQVEIKDLPLKALSRIFDFFDIESLKQSRLVCRLWKQEAGKILLSKYYVTIAPPSLSRPYGKCALALQSWLTNPYATVKAQKLCAQDGKKTADLLKKFPTLRCSVRELKYQVRFHTGPWDSEKLYEIIKLLPKLEALETTMLTLSPNQKWLGDVTSSSNKNPIKLELFIRKLETLKKLKLAFHLGKSIASTFLPHYRRFSCIQSVEMHVGGLSVMSSFMRPNLRIWSITHFIFNLNDTPDIKLIRSFLTRISSTLQRLKIITHENSFASLSSSVSHLDPWRDDWMIPIELHKLESLEIVLPPSQGCVPKNLAQLNPFMLKSIIFALGLPSLKKLAVAFIPWNLEEIVHSWNNISQHFPGGRKLISKSLEELEVASDVLSASSSSSDGHLQTIPVKMWPRLKILKCFWANPEDFDASVLSEFAVSGNLERFHITVGMEKTSDVKKCDKAQTSQFNLSDLKNLKSFCLESRLNEPRHQNSATRLIESDLKFMKSLQCIQFRGVVVDGGPLKSALGPNVPVIFTK